MKQNSLNREATVASQRSASKNYLGTLVTNVLIILLGVATGAISARLLHPAGRGELAAIQLWPMVLAVIATFGMPESLSYFTARRNRESRQYLLTALLMALLFSIPLGGAAYLVLPHLLHSKGLAVTHGARLYLLFLPCYALTFLPAQALRGTGQFWAWNILRVTPSAVWFLILIGYVAAEHVGHTTPTPQSVARSYLIALAGLGVVILATTFVRLEGPISIDFSSGRELLRFGLPVMGATLPVTLNLRLDQLVMTAVTSSRLLGLYVIAASWGGVVSPVLNAFGSLLLPKIAATSVRRQQELIVVRATRLAVLLALTVTTPALLVTPFAIRDIFGQTFDGSIDPALPLVLAGAFLGISYIITESLLGMGLTAGPMRAQTVGFLGMGLSLGVLLPTLGIFGAALASLVGYSVNAMALVREARKATGASIRELTVPRRSDVRDLFVRAHAIMRLASA